MADEVADYVNYMKTELYSKQYIDVFSPSGGNPLNTVVPTKDTEDPDKPDFFGVYVTNFIIYDGPCDGLDASEVADAKAYLQKCYDQFAAYKTWVMINTEGDKWKCMSPTRQQETETNLETACSGMTAYGIVYKGKMNPGAIKDFIRTELKELFGEPPT
jgi:hypothetical protein